MAERPPAAKLPLAARKNVRDGFEAKKTENAAQLQKLLGTEWTFDIDPLAIYPYAAEGSYGYHSLGDCINAYIEGLIYHLQYFIQYHGKEGAEELNAVCPTHTITMKASNKFSYCGTDIEDGKLVLLFHPDCLGTNINNVAEKISETITAAPQPESAPSLSYAARHSIKTEYDANIGEYLEKARKLLDNPEFKFVPEFEELGAKLKASKDATDNWEGCIGMFARDYFCSFVDYLSYEKFGEDEMLREGLAEAVPKGEIKLRIVDKLSTQQNGYNEVILDGEELVIQTTPKYFGTNINNACAKIVDIL